MSRSEIVRLDNIGVVVQDLAAAIAFFAELGMELQGRMTVEGDWVDRVVGLENVRTDIAMMSTPDGHGKLEIMKFRKPASAAPEPEAPVNAPGMRRIMFLVKGIDVLAARLQEHGARLIGETVQYGDTYRLCYLRGPEGIIVALAEETSAGKHSHGGREKKPTLLRMDNLLIVVEDLEAVRDFFLALGLVPQGEAVVEGPLVDKLIGLKNVRATLALLRTPDGHSGIELDKFHSPGATRLTAVNAPANSPGIRRIMLAVTDIDEVVGRMLARGAALIGEVVQYGDMYRLCYLRGPEGLIVALAEQLSVNTDSDRLKSQDK